MSDLANVVSGERSSTPRVSLHGQALTFDSERACERDIGPDGHASAQHGAANGAQHSGGEKGRKGEMRARRRGGRVRKRV